MEHTSPDAGEVAAAAINPNTTDAVALNQPKPIAKLLDELPGMVGGIDRAIFDVSGLKLPFVLLVFAEGGAMHATNIHPAAKAVDAVKQLANAWDTVEPTAHA